LPGKRCGTAIDTWKKEILKFNGMFKNMKESELEEVPVNDPGVELRQIGRAPAPGEMPESARKTTLCSFERM